MAKRFSRRLLFGYSVSGVESYIQQQADHWKQECEKRDQQITQLQQKIEQLNQQLDVRRQQDEALVQALAHAQRMGETTAQKGSQTPAQRPYAEKTHTQKRVEEVIRKNMQSLDALRSRLEKSAPDSLADTFEAPDGLADVLSALEQQPSASTNTAKGLGAAFPGADLSDMNMQDSPDWRKMLHREYEQHPDPSAAIADTHHAKLSQITQELGIE